MRTLRWMLVALLWMIALPAVAQGETEPNNRFVEAEGPLVAGATTTGSLFNDDDYDWFVFYVNGQSQLDIAITHTGGSSCRMYFELYDTDVSGLSSGRVSSGGTEHILYSTPVGVNRYFLQLYGCAGTTYTATISPSNVVVGGEPSQPATPTSEPNEAPVQAVGPLTGGAVYTATTDTVNDVDWFYFHTVSAGELDIQLMESNNSCRAYGYLYGPGTAADSIASTRATFGISHIRYTVTAAGTYYLKFESCMGNPFRFRILPASAISLTPPAPPPTRQGDTRPAPTVSSSGSSARVRGSKVKLNIEGRVTLPSGVSAGQACNGTVVLTIKKGSTLLSARNTTLRRTCRFSKTVNLSRRKVGRATTLKVTARFAGNATLGARTKTFSVRVRR